MTARRISTKAKRILNSTLGKLPNWIYRDQEDQDDIGIDGEIEILDDHDTATGLVFKVQVKGRQSIGEKAGQFSLGNLPTQKMKYYVELLQIPVVLVVVDVNQERVFWEILHGNPTVQGALARAKQHRKHVLTIQMHTENRLPETASRLVAAVSRAIQDLASAVQGVAVAALDRESKRLEQIDPRFRVSATADQRGQHIRVSPKEDIEIKVSVDRTATRSIAKLRLLFNRGQKVTFRAEELTISGSPLLDEARGKNVTMEGGRRRKVMVDIVLRSQHGVELHRIRDVDGVIEGGRTEHRIGLGFSEPFLEIKSGWVKNGEPWRGPNKLTLRYHFVAWVGKPLSQLRRLDDIHELFCRLDCHSIQFETRADGRLINAPMAMWSDREQAQGPQLMVDRVWTARKYAVTFGLDPVLPEELLPQHLSDIDELEWLYSADEPSRPLPASRWKFALARSAIDHLLANTDVTQLYSLVVDHQEPFALFGTPVDVGRVQYELRGLRLGTSVDSLRAMQAHGIGDFVDVEWTTSEGSSLVARKLDCITPMLVKLEGKPLMALSARHGLVPVSPALQRLDDGSVWNL